MDNFDFRQKNSFYGKSGTEANIFAYIFKKIPAIFCLKTSPRGGFGIDFKPMF